MRVTNDDAFSRRLSQCYDELKWLYCELYHNDREAFQYFCEMLHSCWLSRKSALRELDAKREKNPDWYRSNQLLGMMMYPSCFAGNLNGVRMHLPYLEECCVNYLHLMPLLDSPKGKSDGGYAVSDFRSVRPDLGTMEDLEALADDCREHGICLALDFVMNHTSEDHEWAKKPGLEILFAEADISSLTIGRSPMHTKKPSPRFSPLRRLVTLHGWRTAGRLS